MVQFGHTPDGVPYDFDADRPVADAYRAIYKGFTVTAPSASLLHLVLAQVSEAENAIRTAVVDLVVASEARRSAIITDEGPDTERSGYLMAFGDACRELTGSRNPAKYIIESIRPRLRELGVAITIVSK